MTILTLYPFSSSFSPSTEQPPQLVGRIFIFNIFYVCVCVNVNRIIAMIVCDTMEGVHCAGTTIVVSTTLGTGEFPKKSVDEE